MSTSATTPALLHKSLGVEGCKVIDAEHGIVEAYVSGIGNKDSGGDIIVPGAFDNSLRVRKPKGVWSHDWDKPVSKTLEIYEVAAGDSRLPLKMQLAGIGGLYVKTQFNMNTQLGRDAYETVRFYGDEAEWSIGYQVHDAEFDQKMGAMILKEIELYEYSPVLFGMNALTSTVSIKVHKSDDGELEYDINGLDELESKAVSAALKVILEEKQVTVDSEEKADEYAEKPWHIEKRNDKYCVIKDSDGTNEGCHDTRKEAESQMAALYASEGSKSEEKTDEAPTGGVDMSDTSEKSEEVTEEKAEEETPEVKEEAEEVEEKTDEAEEVEEKADEEELEEKEDEAVEEKAEEVTLQIKLDELVETVSRSVIEKIVADLQSLLPADEDEKAEEVEVEVKVEEADEVEAKDDESEAEVKEEVSEEETDEKADDSEADEKEEEVEAEEKVDAEDSEEKADEEEVDEKADEEVADEKTEPEADEKDEESEEVEEKEEEDSEDEKSEEDSDDISDADFMRQLAEFEDLI